MFALIEAYKQSGLTRKDFCEQNSIPVARFYYWQKKQRAQHFGDTGSFIRLTSNGREKGFLSGGIIVLQYPNGVSLQLSDNTPVATIRTLLSLV